MDGHTVNGELARRRPAETVHRIEGVTLPRTETLERSSLKEVKTELRKMARRGEIGATYKLKATDKGWALAYMRIKERRRFAWWKAAVALAGLALVLGAVVLLVKALVALAPYLLAVVGVLALASVLAGGSTTVSVIQSVVIKR